MSPSKSINTAMKREHQRELKNLKREEKAAANAALKQLTALRKEADKIVRLHKKGGEARARRIAILEGRIG